MIEDRSLWPCSLDDDLPEIKLLETRSKEEAIGSIFRRQRKNRREEVGSRAAALHRAARFIILVRHAKRQTTSSLVREIHMGAVKSVMRTN
jgi:hypothetical protein